MLHPRQDTKSGRCLFGRGPGARETRVEGPRVVLRDPVPADGDDYARWFSTDTEWARWDAPWEPLREARSSVRNRVNAILDGPRPHPRKSLEITLGDGTHVGRVTRYADGGTGPWHLGIDVFESRLWGRGTGTGAFGLWIDYLAAHGIEDMRCATWSGNIRMLALARRLGFREVERDPDARVVQGRSWDRVVLEVHREPGVERCGAPAVKERRTRG